MHPVEVLLVPLGKALRNRRADEALSISHAPELATEHHLAVASPAFGDGDEIPAKYCGPFIGQNVSSPLTWDALPSNTAQLILVMEDISTPSTAPAIHTIASLAPAASGLAEGGLAPKSPGVSFLSGRPGRAGKYVGPRPLPGHGPHYYRFHLYALDTAVDLGSVQDAAHLPAAMDGHVLASGTLTGKRTP
jgi:hypothetical protein